MAILNLIRRQVIHMIKLFLTVLFLAALVFLSENPEKEDCRDTWAKVYGPNAREGASWNSEWNGNVTEETCGFYFEEFEN